MIFFALMGAGGVVLFLSGLPLVRRVPLTARVEPYVVGFRRTSKGRRGRALRAVVAALPSDGGDEDLIARLEAAGQRADISGYRLQQAAWTVAGTATAVVVGVALGASLGGFDPRALVVLTAIGGGLGWAARDHHLTRQGERRRANLLEELPVALDLLTLTVMSGGSVPVAFERTATAMGGAVGREFGAVVSDMRSGTPAVEALRTFARRAPDPGVVRLVDALVTAIEKGAPLAEVLRAQADDHREARRRRLLELGGKREVLMLVPVVFLILPVIVLFALYPGLVALDLLVP